MVQQITKRVCLSAGIKTLMTFQSHITQKSISLRHARITILYRAAQDLKNSSIHDNNHVTNN